MVSKILTYKPKLITYLIRLVPTLSNPLRTFKWKGRGVIDPKLQTDRKTSWYFYISIELTGIFLLQTPEI